MPSSIQDGGDARQAHFPTIIHSSCTRAIAGALVDFSLSNPRAEILRLIYRFQAVIIAQ